MCRVMFAAAVAAFLSTLPGVATADDVVGKAQAVDGDTLQLAGKRIHLYGIDAPEEGQNCLATGKLWNCGLEATFALAAEVGNHWITCKVMETIAQDQVKAVCHAGLYDLGTIMVSRGWALARHDVSKKYADEETWAKEDRRGLWRGEFIPPWDWRAGRRLGAESAAAGSRK